jgi:hypothetical protein
LCVRFAGCCCCCCCTVKTTSNLMKLCLTDWLTCPEYLTFPDFSLLNMYKEVFNVSYTKGAIKEVWGAELNVATVQEVPSPCSKALRERFQMCIRTLHSRGRAS